ncbi:hypothetical protein TMatcc_000812 [Talaromyces marneffei ATCC 18224]
MYSTVSSQSHGVSPIMSANRLTIVSTHKSVTTGVRLFNNQR